MDVDQYKEDCLQKERVFIRLARRFDPDEDDIALEAVARHRETWTEQLNEALDELVGVIEEMIHKHSGIRFDSASRCTCRGTRGRPDTGVWWRPRLGS